MQCFAEHGIAMASYPYVCDAGDIVVTWVGILRK